MIYTDIKMKIIKNILIVLFILLIGGFISQSIYWISLGNNQLEFTDFVKSKELTETEIKQAIKKYNLNYIEKDEQVCQCGNSTYIKTYKVTYHRIRETFPFYKDVYSKDSLYYPIMIKP